MSKRMKHFYTVGVRKDYFPEELHPPKREMTAYFQVFKILATDRVTAAQQVWDNHGERLLALMKPDTTINGNRIISLEVNDPVRRIQIGRIGTIPVYEGKGRLCDKCECGHCPGCDFDHDCFATP